MSGLWSINETAVLAMGTAMQFLCRQTRTGIGLLNSKPSRQVTPGWGLFGGLSGEDLRSYRGEDFVINSAKSTSELVG
jgi:hypothetical protein